jgi:hypothetical protein
MRHRSRMTSGTRFCVEEFGVLKVFRRHRREDTKRPPRVSGTDEGGCRMLDAMRRLLRQRQQVRADAEALSERQRESEREIKARDPWRPRGQRLPAGPMR